ncbi:MAG: hypothetical protein ACYS7M_05960 [Planctomycetota bacterium]
MLIPIPGFLLLAIGAVLTVFLVKRLLGASRHAGTALGIGLTIAVMWGLVAFMRSASHRRARSAESTVIFADRDGQRSLSQYDFPDEGSHYARVGVRDAVSPEAQVQVRVPTDDLKVRGGRSSSDVVSEEPGPACEPAEYLRARSGAAAAAAETAPDPAPPDEPTAVILTPGARRAAPRAIPAARGWLGWSVPLPWAILASAALAAMIFLAYLFLDSGTRGHFTWPLRIFAVVAFVGLCGALLLVGLAF